MDELDQRLLECFRSVFPDFSDERIRAVDRSTDSEWDSLQSLTLIAVLEEEFGCRLEDADVEVLDSFDAARAAVTRALT